MLGFEFSRLSPLQRAALLAGGVGMVAAVGTGCAAPTAASAERNHATNSASPTPTTLRACTPPASSETSLLFGDKTPLSSLATNAGRLATCVGSSSSAGENASGQFDFDNGDTVSLSLTADGEVTSTQGLATFHAMETDKKGTIVRIIDASANNGTFLLDVTEQNGDENLYAVAVGSGEPSNFCQTTPQSGDCELATGKAADADGRKLIAEVQGTFEEWMGEGPTTKAANEARAKNPIPAEPQFTNLAPSEMSPRDF